MSSRIPHVSGSSPAKRNPTGYYPFSAAKPTADSIKKDLVLEMRGKFVGPLGMDEFLKEFAPVNKPYDPNSHIGAFDSMRQCGRQIKAKDDAQRADAISAAQETMNQVAKEKVTATDGNEGQAKKSTKEEEMYGTFAFCVAEKKLCPSYTFVPTPNTFDAKEAKIRGGRKVDMALYLDRDVERVRGPPAKPRWDRMALYVEFKSYSNSVTCDPFYVPSSKVNQAFASQDDTAAIQERKLAADRRSTRGQLIAYAAGMFARQQRTHGFSVVVLGEYVRIIRWDRAGAVYTERFNYVEYPENLCKFLWNFAHLDDQQKGYDESAETVEEGSPLHELMMKKIAEGSKKGPKDTQLPEPYELDLFKKLCDPEWPKWRLRVDGPVSPCSTVSRDALSPTKPRYFLVGKPHSAAPGMTGRSTRGYVALDEESNRLVYLKDCWRVDMRDMLTEGQVLRRLNLNAVDHVPTLVCDGDVGEQRTATQNYPSKDSAPLRAHRHYRVVVEEIGSPLDEFKNARELIEIVYHCLLGHAGAFTRAKILHRDISAGNILIVRKTIDDTGRVASRGLLNDWDLSKSTVEGNDQPRRPERTGTWQFMSGRLASNLSKPHLLPDDLESVLHVVIYEAIRCLDHNCTQVGQFMENFFDNSKREENVVCGGSEKILCILSGVLTTLTATGERVEFTFINEHLQGLIKTLLAWLQAYYNINKVRPPTQEEMPKHQELIYVEKSDDVEEIPSDLLQGANPNPDNADLGLEALDEPSERYKVLAKKLETHAAILLLFQSYVKKSWPPVDKRPDQRIRGRTFQPLADR